MCYTPLKYPTLKYLNQSKCLTKTFSFVKTTEFGHTQKIDMVILNSCKPSIAQYITAKYYN